MLDEFRDVLDPNSLYSQIGYFNYAFSMAEEWKDLETAIKNTDDTEKVNVKSSAPHKSCAAVHWRRLL